MDTQTLIKFIQTKTDLEKISETLKDYERGFIPIDLTIKDILYYLGLINKRCEFLKIGSRKLNK